MSDPYERDIITIKASPRLASQAPMDNRMILIKMDWEESAIIDIGIKITSANIILSRNSKDIKRCLLFIINPITAENIQISMIIGVHVFVNIFQITFVEWSMTPKVMILNKLLSGKTLMCIFSMKN